MSAPRYARALIARVAPSRFRDALLGDLDEVFAARTATHGLRRARWWYWRQAAAALWHFRKRQLHPTGRSTRQVTMDDWFRHVRHASRVLRRSPGFTLAAAVTLALGIGANTAIFSVVSAVLLRPLPYAQPDRLVMIWDARDPGEMTWLSVREVLSYRSETPSLEALAAYMDTSANLTGGTEPERVRAASATADLFQALGVAPLLGRGFAPGDDGPGAAEIVVLGERLWQRRFGGRPDIVGDTIRVNGRPRTVVGVMPASLELPLDYRSDRPTELWMPLVIDTANLPQWGNRSLVAIGRLRHDAAAERATSELWTVSQRWIRDGDIQDNGDGGLHRAALPLQQFVTGQVERPLFILLAAVGLVLLIACANVVNLLLARADARQREIALRAAIGAGRRTLVTQLLIESVLLAGIGAALGLALAHAALRSLVALRPAALPRVEHVGLDATALAFTALLALATGVLFGLAPALQLSRVRLVGVLNDGSRGAGPGRVRLAVRRTLVAAQLALAVVLVIGAGLLVRTLLQLNAVDLGFNPQNVLTAQVQLPVTDYGDALKVNQFVSQLMERLAAQPGVVAAGGIRVLPLQRTIGDWSITIEGRPTTPGENPNGDYQNATPGYFAAMGLRPVSGRVFTDADGPDSPLVAVINDTMAARYWPGQDAVGKRFQMGGLTTTLPAVTIVGIIRTVRHNAVVEEPRAEIYLPHAQVPRSIGAPGRSLAVVMRTAGDPRASIDTLREAVRALDPNLPVADIEPMAAVTARALAGPRFAAFLLTLLGALALVLAAIGTYATMALLVSERAPEIGIRLALGADRATILRQVLREGVALALAGATIGSLAALALTRALTTMLYGVGPLDPLTFAAVPTLLVVVALIAALNPARRAARLDPISTLRRA